MSEQPASDHISKKGTVYRIAGMENATIRKDLEYGRTDAEAPLTMDLYYPGGHAGPPLQRQFPAHAAPALPRPAVVLVAGYADTGFETRLGCKFKEMAMSVSWGQLILCRRN